MQDTSSPSRGIQARSATHLKTHFLHHKKSSKMKK
jgi:hypothetical protein